MKVVAAPPDGATLARVYGPSTSIVKLESDLELVVACGRAPAVVRNDAGGFQLWLEPTVLEQLASEPDPRARRELLQREIDSALEPRDPGGRERAREVELLEQLDGHRGIRVIPPAEAPHAFDAGARVRE